MCYIVGVKAAAWERILAGLMQFNQYTALFIYLIAEIQ